MAPPNRYKEWFSWSVVAATTSAAGLVCQPLPIDANKADVQISSWGALNGRVRTVALQLKSTSSPKFIGPPDNQRVAFRLDRDDYNSLILPNNVPTFLVVVGVPDLDGCWVKQQPSQVVLNAGAWWLRVSGQPTEQETITVHLPIEQRFNASALREMLDAE